MTGIEDRLLGIEVSIEALNETLDESSKYLKLISREMIISNLPKEIHDRQRQMFELCDDLTLEQRVLKYYKERLREAKDDLSRDGYKDDIEKKMKKIDDLYTQIGELAHEGCIVV